MIPSWIHLDEQNLAAFRATIVFLEDRLTQSSTIDWALNLKASDHIPRVAIEEILTHSNTRSLSEPWATAWRLIEEAWSEPAVEKGPSTAIYGIQERLRSGDRSGSIISAIVNLVAPRLSVEPNDAWRWNFIKRPRRPRKFDDLLSARLSSGDIVDLKIIGLHELEDVAFLKALANALERAFNHGLDIGRRLGWDGKTQLWKLGDLGRVEYVAPDPNEEDDQDPDAYHHGIAPSVKLFYAVVSRISDLEPRAAIPFVQRWQHGHSSVHIRLWAAIAKSNQLVSTDQVTDFLATLDEREFWDLDTFPEIAELRARRFHELEPKSQNAIVTRIRKGPPRNFWPKTIELSKVKNARLYWVVRELRRIEVAGGELPPTSKLWLRSNIHQFDDLQNMSVHEGFSEGPKVRSVVATPDDRYSSIQGEERLRALETAFATKRGGWDDDPAQSANYWLTLDEHVVHVIKDLASVKDGGDEFPMVWNRVGWGHTPRSSASNEASQRDLHGEADLVFGLLLKISEATIRAAIEGLSYWLDSWGKQLPLSHSGPQAWLRLWPLAIEATNTRPDKERDSAALNVIADTENGNATEPKDLDTLNTPTGRLVGAFLQACPSLKTVATPFAAGTPLREMRDLLIKASGRSDLVARHRLIEALPYFLNADAAWTQEKLITPLLKDDGASIALWQAIGRRTHFTDVLKIIGGAMATKATDRRLSRDTRRGLVFSLVVESLHAFREKREPAVPNSRLQQTLRTLDDEVRANAANAVQRYIRQLSAQQATELDSQSAADLFRSAAMPFLNEVWPQERSLTTPSVSRALADLPATSGEAFAQAVRVIERFLVPFECWSMHDYGLRGDEGGVKKLSKIDTPAESEALLRLLDLTIGSSEGSVIPYDLTDALDQIRVVSPNLANSSSYRRLATAARR
ncbi:hypothetical protein AB7828_18860 [Tardiphaga sp. 215_C5_N2_1]|uniref:hypothetical protein n=1 Tax=Tardiphaga sp. 215_C5_N2_1 TaxID=3240774 RepID=UPI003F8BFCE6